MAAIQSGGTPTWSNKLTFIMAAVGSSVGLGNFWKFPYEAGQNGGGAFVLVYLLCVLLVAFPLLVSEYIIGRHKGVSAVNSLGEAAVDSGVSRGWSIGGWTGIIGSFLILCFYCIVAGWVMAYIWPMFTGEFSGKTYEEVAAHYDGLTSSKPQQLFWQAAFVALTVFIVSRGIKGGIEKAVNILMPAFFIIFVGIVIYASALGNFGEAFKFLFAPDFSKITTVTLECPDVIAAGMTELGGGMCSKSGLNIALFSNALGQAFFSVGVGVGLMITYGSYLGRDTNIMRSGGIVAGADTLVALVAGFAIFPIVFATGADPDGGPGLFFKTLPVAFAQMPGGSLIGGLFFILAFFAAITSSISLLEVSVAHFSEDGSMSRSVVSVIAGVLIFLVGAVCVVVGSFNYLDVATTNFLLPIGGLIVVLFTGWRLSKAIIGTELADANRTMFKLWFVLIKYVAPIGVLFILSYGLFQLVTG